MHSLVPLYTKKNIQLPQGLPREVATKKISHAGQFVNNGYSNFSVLIKVKWILCRI